MEEGVKLLLLGQQLCIRKASILTLHPLITQQALKEIGFPRSLGKFKPQLKVLHSCIYYLIVVQKNLQEIHSLDFREKCLSSISDYYIKQNMNFQIFEYGYLCAKILSIPIDKAIHIIYFLVFARLASKAFIDNMIMQMEKKVTQFSKKVCIKSEKQFSSRRKSLESRHFTVFFDTNQIETDSLKKQLEKILRPQEKQSKKMTKKIDNKRYFNLKKIYPDSNGYREDIQTSKAIQFSKSVTSRLMTIPSKVRQKQHSSIINRLKFKSGFICFDDALKKIEVRRQKFNEWLDNTDSSQKTTLHWELKENKRNEWGTLKNITDKQQKNVHSNNYKNQKHPYQYYQGIASNIRNKNQQLDSIRFQCIHHNQKTGFYTPKQPLNSRSMNFKGFLLSKHLLRTQSATIQDAKPDYYKSQTNRQIKENLVKQDNSSQQAPKEKDFSKSSTNFNGVSQNEPQDHAGNVITRKNEKLCVQDQKHLLFSKKVKNKFKLQKYKQEYRQFLKTQIVQKFKDNS